MKKPIVSVLIPVYNVEKYLKKCLESVTGQTLTNIEIICVNDGSTDNSLKILEKYKALDSRIKIVNKENGGLPSARNAALDIATGEYVGFVDSDDYIEANMFERLVEVAHNENSEVVICGANIFPERPRADEWLYTCLSPWYKHYDKFDPELLYWRQDTNPFLWRVLVSKKLIDRENLRLDEDIIVGEDKAFQAKLYPKAQGISVIPDKLYNYYWCRPDSLMSKQVYGSLEKRVFNHSKLVSRIGEDIVSGKFEKNVCEGYLEWAISFIYEDFIYLDKNSKRDVSEILIPVWKSVGYYSLMNDLPQWKRDAFGYIFSFENIEKSNINISIIVPIEFKSRYVDDFIKNSQKMVNSDIEIIIINNGMSNENCIKIQKWLYSEPNLRLYNTPKHLSYAESLNCGIDLAKGNYITFSDSHDWYEKDNNSLIDWQKFALEKKSEVCLCNFVKKISKYDMSEEKIISKEKDKIYEASYHDCLFKRQFLLENELQFKDNSLITGFVFMCKAILIANEVSKYNHNVYITRKMHTADWISTKKCEALLEGLEELLKLSLETKDFNLHGKVFSLLNSDLFKQLIVNNTKPYTMPTKQCPNGENSQINTVSKLLKIVSMADYEMLREYGFNDEQSIVDTLCEVIKQRHVFLGKLSDECR